MVFWISTPLRKDFVPVSHQLSLTSILSSNLTFPLPLLAGFLRFQYPHDYKKPSVRTDFPGPQAQQALQDAGAA